MLRWVCFGFFLCPFITFVGGRLVLLHVLFRNGETTVEKQHIYTKDPYRALTYYPIGHGQLIKVGKRRMFALGETLREYYGDFLNETYSPDVLYAQTTDTDRTKSSLELVLAGLYPPTKELKWNSDLEWQPIPYVYKSSKHPVLSGRFTDEYQTAYYRNVYSKSYQKRVAQYAQLFQYLSANTGWDVKRFHSAKNIYKCLNSEKNYGLRLPSWTDPVFPDDLERTFVEELYQSTADVTMRKYGAGFFLRKVLNDTKSKLDGTLKPPGRQLFLYSAHETNLAYLLITLGISLEDVPDYGSYMIFEIHTIGNSHGIKLLYQNHHKKKPTVLKLPNCTVICPLDQFEQLYKKYLPSN